MSLLSASLFALCLFILLDKLAIPFVLQKEFKSKFAELSKVTWIAGLAFLRKVALLTFMTYGCLLALLTLVNLSSASFKNTDHVVARLLSFFSGIETVYTYVSDREIWVVLAILGFALLLLSIGRIRDHVHRLYANLKQSKKDGTLADLEANPEMEAINDELLRNFHNMQQVETSREMDGPNKYRMLGFIQKRIMELLSGREEIDLRRRIIPAMEADNGAWGPGTGKGGLFKTLYQFFVSKGLVRSTYKFSGIFSNIGIVLLLLALLTGNGAVRHDIQQSYQRVYSWHIEGKKKKIDQNWKDKLSGEVVNPDWTDEDEVVLNAIARSAELSAASAFSPVSTPPPSGPADHSAFHDFANAIRYNILKVSSFDLKGKPRPGYKVHESYSGYSASDTEYAGKKEWASAQAKHSASQEPTTDFGKKVKESVREKVKKSPKGYWEKIKTDWRAFTKSFSVTLFWFDIKFAVQVNLSQPFVNHCVKACCLMYSCQRACEYTWSHF